MRRLELDYLSHAGGVRWLGLSLLAIAALACAKQANVFATVSHEVTQSQARLARLEARDRPAAKAALPESTIKEIRRANDVIEQIALPWDRMFRSLESAAGEKVGLLGITPDQKSGTVEVGGEASDLNAMFDYVKRLQRQPTLTRVYLLNHKLNEQDSQHPIRFTVTASWMEKKPGS